jgi:hypothetical protein
VTDDVTKRPVVEEGRQARLETLRVVTPDTTPEEVAAIVAVLSAVGSAAGPAARRRTEWNSPYRQVRPFYSHGPGGWRSSGLPKHRGRGT